MLLSYYELRQRIIAALLEGGLKLPPDKRVDLTPQLVQQASRAYLHFLDGWNEWLERQGHAPVKPEGPSGSSVHASRDIVDRPNTSYGDVDYLVTFPIEHDTEDFGSKRKAEANAARVYTELLTQYIRTVHPNGIDAALTLKGTPLQVIVKVGTGTLVQVDTTVTFPEHSEWMKGRYSPERGIKGYVSGNLYKALGDALTLSIGTEGVLVRTKGDARVSSRERTGVSINRISNNFRTFLADIANYLAPDVSPDPLLEEFPGLDPDAVSISDLAQGILGLAKTLDGAGVIEGNELLTKVLNGFAAGMEENVGKKVGRELSPAKATKLKLLNREQLARVKQIFGV